MDDKVFARFLHDMSSPLSVLSMLTESSDPSKKSLDALCAMTDIYRSIFFSSTLDSTDVKNILKKIATYYDVTMDLALESNDVDLNKTILVIGFLLCKINQKGIVHLNSSQCKAKNCAIARDHPLVEALSPKSFQNFSFG